MQVKYIQNSDEFKQFFDSTQILKNIRSVKQQYVNLVQYSIHDPNDEDFQVVINFLKDKQYKDQKNQKLSKALAIFLGNAVGDALGAHTEFIPINVENIIIENGWSDLEKVEKRCEYGQVTDDCSMARCLADSILINNFQFDGFDIRYRFLLWWHFGYNNTTKSSCSFGLGGNIKEGMKWFYVERSDFVSKTRGNTSGNGSIMRNSPVPIAFHSNLKEAMLFADKQSLTTHDGIEAAECCRFLTYLCVKLLNYEGNNPKADILEKTEEFIQLNDKDFYPLSNGIEALVKSTAEKEEDLNLYDRTLVKDSNDRFWNWQYPYLVLSPSRLKHNPSYYGSYSMDALYIALHIVYNTTSFREAIFRAVNLGGDSDSIASVVGQICGAMYGLQDDILDLYQEQIFQYDEYTVLLKAYKLFNHKPVGGYKVQRI